jgi:hypothetical protein
MFRYHRILYRRLLRGQSNYELIRLREESASFPTLSQLIDDELERRRRDLYGRVPEASLTVLPFVARASVIPLS